MASFCGKDKRYTDEPKWFDPLGPTRGPNGQAVNGPTGGPEQRSQIFDYLSSFAPEIGQGAQQGVDALNRAAASPGWDAVQGNAISTARGNNLGGAPQLHQILNRYQKAAATPTDYTNRVMSGRYLNSAPGIDYNLDPMLAGVRQRGQAEAADATSRVKSDMARAGIGFSTANQQAQQADAAAATARSNETEASARTQARIAADTLKNQNYMQERGAQDAAGAAQQGAIQSANANAANTLAQNFATERGYQANAPAQLEAAYNPQINYLSQRSNQLLSPLAQWAQIVQGLSGNGQIATPNSTIVRQPGIADYGMAAMGALSGGAGGTA